MSEQVSKIVVEAARKIAIEVCCEFVSSDPLLYCPSAVIKITTLLSAEIERLAELRQGAGPGPRCPKCDKTNLQWADTDYAIFQDYSLDEGTPRSGK